VARNDDKKIYCLSGLGVDHRVFDRLNLPGIELVHIPWIASLPKETLEQYASRLFAAAELPEEYCLAGVSFGGMIAIEFAKIRPPQQLLLISTLTDTADLPFLFKAVKVLRLHRIIPAAWLKRAHFLTYWFFGAKTTNDKALLKQILRDTDPGFLRWALNAVLHWSNTTKPAATMIHGSKDRILPPTAKADHLIKGAGHFMIVTHPNQIKQAFDQVFAKA
jgi:pimeloyl-ACP methyl ester carboxylesterase